MLSGPTLGAGCAATIALVSTCGGRKSTDRSDVVQPIHGRVCRADCSRVRQGSTGRLAGPTLQYLVGCADALETVDFVD